MLFIVIVAGLMGWGYWQFHHAGKMSGKRIRQENEALNEDQSSMN